MRLKHNRNTVHGILENIEQLSSFLITLLLVFLMAWDNIVTS